MTTFGQLSQPQTGPASGGLRLMAARDLAELRPAHDVPWARYPAYDPLVEDGLMGCGVADAPRFTLDVDTVVRGFVAVLAGMALAELAAAARIVLAVLGHRVLSQRIGAGIRALAEALTEATRRAVHARPEPAPRPGWRPAITPTRGPTRASRGFVAWPAIGPP